MSSLQVVNDTIYAMFQSADSSGNPIGAFNIFDKNGALISTQYFDIPMWTGGIGTNFNTLIHANDSGFAYGGWAQGATQTQNCLLLLKYDRHGVFQWYKEIIDTNYLNFECTAFLQDSLSNYYFSGYLTHKVSMDDDMYIVKTDSLGNLIYKIVLTDSILDDYALGLSINNKGHILVGGDGQTPNPVDLSKLYGYMEIYELDDSGNVLNFVMNQDTNGPGAGNILPLKDGGYMISDSYICDRTQNYVTSIGAIAKLDSDFNVIWRTDIGVCSIYNAFFSLKKAPDGNYIATGVAYNDYILDTHPRNGIVVKISETGQIIWSKEYRGLSNYTNYDDNDLTSIGFLSDSSIITGGEALDYADTIHPQQGWLLHLDTAGCLPDSSTCGIADGIVTIPQASGSVRAYPDPASDRIQFEVVLDRRSGYTLHITDLLGQAVSDISTPPQSTTITIDVRSWSPGLYLYRVTSGYGFTATGRFIVSH